MSNGAKLLWSEAVPWGISTTPDSRTWNSGRALDVLPLGNDDILVASETSGVWWASAAGDALPLSDSCNIPSFNTVLSKTFFL
jgi:hypothetical protein